MPRQFAHVSCSVNMEWGFKQNRVAVVALQKCGKSDSQIFELLKPLKILSIGQLNVIRNCGVLKTWVGQDARGVSALRPLSRQCGSGLAKIHSGNRIPCPES